MITANYNRDEKLTPKQKAKEIIKSRLEAVFYYDLKEEHKTKITDREIELVQDQVEKLYERIIKTL